MKFDFSKLIFTDVEVDSCFMSGELSLNNSSNRLFSVAWFEKYYWPERFQFKVVQDFNFLMRLISEQRGNIFTLNFVSPSLGKNVTFSGENQKRQVRSLAISILAHLAFTHYSHLPPPPGTKIHSSKFKLSPLSPFFLSSNLQSFTISTTCIFTRITISTIYLTHSDHPGI